MKIKISVPASTANLGPGFDSIGCAVDMFLEVEAEKYAVDVGHAEDRLRMSYEGDSEHLVPCDKSNLIVQSALHLIAKVTGKSTFFTNKYELDLLPCGLSLHVKNPIPLSRGLGSSGAAIVAGVVLSNWAAGYNLSKDELMDHILDIEGHPDNVGASLYGGAIAAFVQPAVTLRKCGYAKIVWNPRIKCVAVVPDYHLSTAECRKVLPQNYSRADCVSNIQRVAVLTCILSQDNPDTQLFHNVLADCIHQPYRFKLIPGLEHIIQTITPDNTPGLLGIVLSGAGPTIMALSISNYDQVAMKIVEAFKTFNITSKHHVLNVVDGGAKILGA